MAQPKTAEEKLIEHQLRMVKLAFPHEYAEITALMADIEKIEANQTAKTDFLAFARLMWPGILLGPHHRTMAKVIEAIVLGQERRAIVNMAPRMTKSEFFSYLMPAWYLGHYPGRKIIQICGTGDMAIGWSRKVRNLVATQEYQQVFPDVTLRQDSKAAGRWHTNHGGEYFAVGAEGNVTGKGGDVIIIDDPTGEQQAVAALGDPQIYRKVYDWYVAGPRQRLQPGGRIAVVQSRWATNDFTGQLLEAEKRADGPNVDHWNLIELPAILPSGAPIWPEFWSFEELERTRMSLPPQRWQAQYMQQPSSDHSAILKRDWWRIWKHDEPPVCELKMVTMDTAYSDKESADYSACTCWGLFNGADKNGKELPCLILLDAWKERLTFPDLKAAAHKYYLKWNPDIFIVEAKASGHPLIYELRARGIPVSEYTPVRGTKNNPNTKIMRANGVSDLMASGIVYAPNKQWADDVIEECASFPGGEHDDWVDCVVMALMRFRQGGMIRLATDSWDSEPLPVRRARAYY